MFFNEEKFRQRAAELEGRRWAQKSSVEWFYTKEGGLGADEVYTSCPEAFEGDKIRLGEEFGTVISGCRGRLPYLFRSLAVRLWDILISEEREAAETAVLSLSCT